MKRYYLLIILSSLISLLSCEKINYMYYLEKDSNMTFDLNYDVEPYIKALFPYTDKDGHQYISFQNGFNNLMDGFALPGSDGAMSGAKIPARR